MSQGQVKVAVVGVGYLGKFHAEKLKRLKGAKLVAVVDSNLMRARSLASDLGVQAFADHRQVMDLVQAATVATPTVTYRWPRTSEAGKDVVEKPITAILEQANELVALAEQKSSFCKWDISSAQSRGRGLGAGCGACSWRRTDALSRLGLPTWMSRWT
ncbi:hypothetical protein DFAR_310011 [Desulfarculales bacterium]